MTTLGEKIIYRVQKIIISDFLSFNESKGKLGTTDSEIFSPHNSLRYQLSFELNVRLLPPVVRKLTIIAEKSFIVWHKFLTLKAPFSRICHSLRALTYIAVCDSSSTIRMYWSHSWILSGIRPSGGSFRVCTYIK